MYIAHCNCHLQVLKVVICIQAILCPKELWNVSVRTQLVFCSKYFLAHILAFAAVSQWRLYSTLRTCLQAGCESTHHSNILCCKCWQNITFHRLLLKAYSLHHKTPAKADIQATNCLLQKASYVLILTYIFFKTWDDLDTYYSFRTCTWKLQCAIYMKPFNLPTFFILEYFCFFIYKGCFTYLILF